MKSLPSSNVVRGAVVRNRILHLTRSTIPYVKELQALTGTVAGCILMQQLDYWFERCPEGFWKFLEPSGHRSYKQGDSWVEELGMSADEFRTAFDKIGIRHKSKGQFDQTQDKFKGKFYCSYLDRRENLTFYFRNHDLVDGALDALIFNNKQVVSVTGESQSPVNQKCRFTGDGESPSLEIRNVDLQETGIVHINNTETTSSKITQKLQPPSVTSYASCGGNKSKLVFPAKLGEEEKAEIGRLLEKIQNLSSGRQQELLDELAGAIFTNSIQKGKVPYFRSLIKSAQQGSFEPSQGLAILVARNKAINGTQALLQIDSRDEFDQVAAAKGESMVSDIRNKRLIKEAYAARGA